MSITTAPPGIVYVSRQWGRLPVTNMFDVDSEQTTDPAEACVVTARLPDGRWLSASVGPGDLCLQGLS